MPKPRKITEVDVNGKTQYRVEGDTQPQLYPTQARAEERDRTINRNERMRNRNS
ncbi:hypothetical protein ACFY0F_23595 [Streptomyces sp. NPDC001544]|uniref:hypothetical protein n=1 Tax=Streptomyces sp. NPDC001544 TaxID=3364584 RepID=UPI0036930DBC